MYRKHFGLTVSPFGISPRLDFLYKSGAFEESMAHLVYGLENSEAIVMITGAIGTGKTMAVQSFLSHLGDRYISALVTNTTVDAKELLKLILEDLDLPVSVGADKSDLLIAFKQMLIEVGKQGKRVIIVVDEAQNLSREVLEEIRLLTNLGQGEQQPVQIVLVGQPELETAVERPDLAQLRQRIRVHYKLAPLTRRELEEYVNHRMQVAGGKAGTFAGAAFDRIFELSGGVPRVVNTLCGDALLSAYVAGRRKVEPQDISVGGGSVSPHGAAPLADGATTGAARGATVDAGEPASGEPREAPEARPSAPQPSMAVRREPGSAPAASEKVKAPKSARPARAADTAPSRPAPKRNRTGVFVAMAGIVAIVAVLAATGQWQSLAKRFTGTAVEAQAEHAGPAVPIEENAGTTIADSFRPVATDSGGQVAADGDTAAVTLTELTEPGDTPPGAGVVPAVEAESEATVVPAQAAAAVQVATSTAEERLEDGPSTNDWFIHVSSFRTPEHAGAVARSFSDAGQPAVVRQQLVRDAQWYRVYLGPYSTHDDAVRRANGMRDAGTITYYKVLRLEPGSDS